LPLLLLINKMTIFWDMLPCNLLERCHRLGGAYCLHIRDRRCRNVSTPLPNHTASHPRTPQLYIHTRDNVESQLIVTLCVIFGYLPVHRNMLKGSGSECPSWRSATQGTHRYIISLSKYFYSRKIRMGSRQRSTRMVLQLGATEEVGELKSIAAAN
jgi:hypothetical protein